MRTVQTLIRLPLVLGQMEYPDIYDKINNKVQGERKDVLQPITLRCDWDVLLTGLVGSGGLHW